MHKLHKQRDGKTNCQFLAQRLKILTVIIFSFYSFAYTSIEFFLAATVLNHQHTAHLVALYAEISSWLTGHPALRSS